MSQHRLMRVLARNIDYQLFKRSWNGQRLATELGLDVRTVSRLRTASTHRIDPEIFQALCDVFGCTPNDLLTEQDELLYTYI
jgi:DNA-binding Xre family transcriptional regulator